MLVSASVGASASWDQKGTNEARTQAADFISKYQQGLDLFLAKIADLLRHQQLRFDFEERSSRMSNRLDEFASGCSSRSFCNITWNRDGGAPNLRSQTVELFAWEFPGYYINRFTKFDSFLPNQIQAHDLLWKSNSHLRRSRRILSTTECRRQPLPTRI